jgi:hypothetical protein
MPQQDLGVRDKVDLLGDGGVVHHRAKRLTRLSGLVPLGTCVAILGNWGLWLPTMPLISAAKVFTCLAILP